MRWTLLLLLFAAGCSRPEALTANKVLGCFADRDRRCLLRYYAPVVPRLAAWAAAAKVERLFVGRYARRAMRDADDPYWALLPVACARRIREEGFSEPARAALGDCSCRTAETRSLAPAATRREIFAPRRERARKLHPAMEILGLRSTAEALRVTTLARVQCRCGDRRVDLGMLDLQGRVPRWRFFKVTGICEPEPAETLATQLGRARRLLSGEAPLP